GGAGAGLAHRSTPDRCAHDGRSALSAHRDPDGAARPQRRARHRHQSAGGGSAPGEHSGGARRDRHGGGGAGADLRPPPRGARDRLRGAQRRIPSPRHHRHRRPRRDDVEPRDPARHRQPSRPEQEPDRIRLRRLGAGPARGRARPRLLVHDPARRQAGVRRGPRRGLGRRHETPDAGPLSAGNVARALVGPVRDKRRVGLPRVGDRRRAIPLAIPAQPTARRCAAPAPRLHSFRFIGLAFLVPGVVAPELSVAFARPAAYGDLIAAVLALLALACLRSRWGMPLVWVFNLWGTADLLYAFYQGNAVGFAPGQLGAAYFIPTVIVPLLLITHGLVFRLLLRGRGRPRIPIGARQPSLTADRPPSRALGEHAIDLGQSLV